MVLVRSVSILAIGSSRLVWQCLFREVEQTQALSPPNSDSTPSMMRYSGTCTRDLFWDTEARIADDQLKQICRANPKISLRNVRHQP